MQLPRVQVSRFHGKRLPASERRLEVWKASVAWSKVFACTQYLVYKIKMGSFRNELGGEPLRHFGLIGVCDEAERNKVYGPNETWYRENTAREAHILEDVSNVYIGGRFVFFKFFFSTVRF